MARINNGILGGISGNAGSVEGYVRYGVAYVSGKKPHAYMSFIADDRRSISNSIYLSTFIVMTGL